MKILINGLGCSFGGNRIVLNELLSNLPSEVEATVVFAKTNDVNAITENKAKIYELNHNVFGILLRPIFDLLVNVYFKIFDYDIYLNLSNYGICLTNNQILYLHEPYMFDVQNHSSAKHYYKRKAFNTYLFHRSKIFFQTDHIRNEFRQYLKEIDIDEDNILADVKVLKPCHLIEKVEKNKAYNHSIKFFYPASHFAHKNVKLAIQSIKEASRTEDIKLTITVDKLKGQLNFSKQINFIGKIEYDEVISQFNNSDALLFTSEKETLGLPLLEALSIGMPAVLPNLPYATEIYGDAAVYFDKFEVEEVKKAIFKLKFNFKDYKERAEKRWQHEKKKRVSWSDHWNYFKN